MQELDDNALLREYTGRDSEEAFATLVARHVNKVYSVAFRHTGNTHSAEEITQAVFVILAKKSRQLSKAVILSGWLYQTARLTVVTFIRSEIRRARREQEAAMQNIPDEGKSDAWTQISPLLDSAMAGLGETDRHAVVLRFFDGLSLAEVGEILGTSEDAAKMRVNRAVEKLRLFFAKHGVVTTVGILTTTISASAVQAAPVALAKTATVAALAKGATASVSTLTLIKGAMKIMAWTQAKTAIVSVVVIGLAVYSVIQHQAQTKLRADNELLQQQMAQMRAENQRLAARPREVTPHLPAPPFQMAAQPAAAPAQSLAATNLYARLKNIPAKLTREQLEPYLKANGRSAASLLAAFRTSGDPALLAEAMQKYPNDPQVAFEAAFDQDLSPTEQRQWLDAFEKSAPDNAMANYLSALNYFNAGQIDQGVQELTTASGKAFQDYTLSRIQDDEEAYLAAGDSLVDAKALASSQLLLPQLAQMKQLGLDIVDLANAYTQTSDQASGQAALQMAAGLGQRYAYSSPGVAEISQLVGMVIERRALQAMDPNSPHGNDGQTVQGTLSQLVQEQATLNQLDQQAEPLLPTLSDQDWVVYKDRWIMFGEQNALQWVVGKYGQQ